MMVIIVKLLHDLKIIFIIFKNLFEFFLYENKIFQLLNIHKDIKTYKL